MTQEKTSLNGVSILSNDYDHILAWLSGPDFAPVLQENLKKATHGTGRWFLTSERYRDWVNGDTNDDINTLWCTGPHGIGKTTLMSFAIKNLQDMRDAKDGIGYVFFDNESREEQTTTNMVRALTCQLIQDSKYVSPNAWKVYERHHSGGSSATLEDYHAILFAQIQEYQRVYLVIDAVDECEVETRLELFDTLLRLREAPPQIHVLVSSRNVDSTFAKLGNSFHFVLKARTDDLAKFVEEQVNHKAHLHRFILNHSDLIEITKNELTERADEMHCFLTITLQLELLEAIPTWNRDVYLDQLRQLPRGSNALELTYKAFWKRILQQDSESVLLAKAILTWLCFTEIPRDITTFRHALTVARSDLTSINDDMLIKPDLISSVCLGLVVISETTGQVRFVHYTAQEFFPGYLQREIPDTDLIVATSCIRYLSIDGFDTNAAEAQLASALSQYPLLEFAATTWGSRVAQSSEKGLRPILLRFLKNPAKVNSAARVLVFCREWKHEGVPEIPKDVLGLHLAAYFGLIGTFCNLADFDEPIDVMDSNGWTPLRWAAYGDQPMVIELLIKSGSNLTSTDCNGESTLMWGLGEPVPKSILSHCTVSSSAKLLVGDIQSSTIPPELQASPDGHVEARTSKEIIEILIAKTDNIDLANRHGRTALSRAAENHQVSHVSQLLERGADRNLEDNHFMTALLWALQWPWGARNTRHIKNTEVSGDSQVVIGDTHSVTRDALQSCLRPSWTITEDMIRRLIGSNYKAKDMNGKSTLALAAERSYVEIVKALLDRIEDPDGLEISTMAPLTLASQRPCFQQIIVDGLQVTDSARVICGPVFYFPDGRSALEKTDHVPSFFQRREDIVNLYLDKIITLGHQVPDLTPFIRLANRDGLTNVAQVLRKRHREHHGDTTDSADVEEQEADMDLSRTFQRGELHITDNGKLTAGSFGAVSTKLRNIATHSDVRITFQNSSISDEAQVFVGPIFTNAVRGDLLTDMMSRMSEFFEIAFESTEIHEGRIAIFRGDGVVGSDVDSP